MNQPDLQPIVSACVPGWANRPPLSPPYLIGVLPGGGIGPEVIGAALGVLDAVSDRYGVGFEVRTSPDLGSPGRYGPRLTDELADFFASMTAACTPVLCGPVGGRFVYELRSRFSLFCKLVPLRPSPALVDAAIVDPERIRGVDVLVVRENVGGLYQGEFGRRDGGQTAYQHLSYTADQVSQVIAVAVRASLARRGHLTVVTKSGGIPEVSALWCERAGDVAAGQPVTVEELEIDNACFQLVAEPKRFDVIVAPNLLGDVLADCGTLLLGSRGMSVSANFGVDGVGVYQTGHGLARDLAGSDRANPVAQILSLALLLRESLGLVDAARSIEDAVERVLGAGYRTADIAGPESTIVGTRELGDQIAETIAEAPARSAVE